MFSESIIMKKHEKDDDRLKNNYSLGTTKTIPAVIYKSVKVFMRPAPGRSCSGAAIETPKRSNDFGSIDAAAATTTTTTTTTTTVTAAAAQVILSPTEHDAGKRPLQKKIKLNCFFLGFLLWCLAVRGTYLCTSDLGSNPGGPLTSLTHTSSNDSRMCPLGFHA